MPWLTDGMLEGANQLLAGATSESGRSAAATRDACNERACDLNASLANGFRPLFVLPPSPYARHSSYNSV